MGQEVLSGVICDLLQKLLDGSELSQQELAGITEKLCYVNVLIK
jgi:hypothetical protein